MVQVPVAIPPKRERTRSAIIAAAIAVIAEHGLEAANIDALMHSAGMSRGTFYNYFPSRDAVLWAVVDHICERVASEVAGRLPDDLGPEALVACMILGFLQFGSNNPELGWAQVHIGGGTPWLVPDDPAINRFQNLNAALSQLLGDDAALALGIAYIEGVALMALRRLLEQRIAGDDVARLVAFTLRGLDVPRQRIAPAVEVARRFAETLRHRPLQAQTRER
ncbi:MAG TPA: TetR/AcrR family transcriptional regulator [Spongiibacteraceae bacterium]|jgi:AcrR family transcriptional regulator|nr:TetR/AcrR family transcriptional regulator [Spongiibacteraceae bacterium]HUH36745.1 TetR/AcrR family transcriptional regulator [Spongiibacteraceae bacterium]